MNISEIKRAFNLTKDITQKTYVLIPVLARKMKVSEFDLMDFINSNPKLFHTETIWSYSNKKVKRRVFPHDKKTEYTDTIQVKNKNLGLGIKSVYEFPEDNFRTKEWLNFKIKNSSKYLFISELNDYGYIHGYEIKIDVQKSDDSYRYHLWRNTNKKVEELKQKGFLKEQSFTFGGFGDSWNYNAHNSISSENIKILKELGWTFNEVKPIGR